MSEFRTPGEGEMLGKVLELLGDNRVKVVCQDGEVRVARIPGRYRKRLWLKPGDYVVVAVWDFDPKKGDVVHKYEKRDLDELRRRGFGDVLDNLDKLG